MRTIVSFFALMQFSCSLFGQEAAVPKNVIKAFKHQYRSAEIATWYVEPKHYEVQFLDGNKEKVAFYAKSNGNLLQTKVLIDEKEIPNDVMHAIRNRFPDFIFDDFSRIVCPDDSFFFNISLRSSGISYNLDYSAQGMILGEEKAHKNADL